MLCLYVLKVHGAGANFARTADFKEFSVVCAESKIKKEGTLNNVPPSFYYLFQKFFNI
jgi:hypothetical protein